MVDHTTVYQWVQAYALELDQRCRPHLRSTNDSWRVDETYIKIKGEWKYLYRAVDSKGTTQVKETRSPLHTCLIGWSREYVTIQP